MTRRTFATLLMVGACLWGAPAYAEETLTLDVALKTALKANPSLVSARELHNAANAKVGQSMAGYLPQANATLAYSRKTANSMGTPFTSEVETNDSYNSYAAQLSVNQLIYDFGKTGGAYDAAQSEAQATASDADLSAQVVILNTTQAFFAVLANQENLQAATDAKKQMEQHLALADGQVAAGVRPMIDVTRAKADLANANLTLIRATNQLAVAKSTLNAFMGQTGKTAAYHVERPQLSREVEAPSLEEAVQKAMALRPDYLALKARRDAVAGNARTVRAGYFPVVAANGALTYAGSKPDSENMLRNWSVGATASWNFFSGFATTNASDEFDARLRALDAQLTGLEIQVRNDVETAYLALAEAYERLAPTQAALAASQETLALAEARYQAGAGSIVEIADAQTLFTQARTNAIQADFDLQVARVRLQKATGELVTKEK